MSIRGLPDERPRPSVANLIGRFEQRATKRQSVVGSPTASPSQSRSTSVVSHTTGDAALIEAKERREWPPQSQAKSPMSETNTFNFADLRRSLDKRDVDDSARSSVVSPPLDAPSDDQASLSASVEIIAKDPEPVTEPQANSDPPIEPAPVVEEIQPDPVKKEPQTAVRAPGRLMTSKSNPSSANAPRSATAKAATPRHSAIAPSKSTPSTPAKTAKPLTAQRTGTSTTSAASRAARAGAKSPPVSAPRASTSGTLSKASPASISRAKTPTASPASAAARSKTPTASHAGAGAARPKTPSGLFAPTKASLARARNAEAPPPVAHKTTLPSSALERLMKPTAASASKVRATPVSPPRAPAVKPARGTAPVRGKTVKPRVGLAPARMKAEREKKQKEGAVKSSPAAVNETPEQHLAPSDYVMSEDEHEYIEHDHMSSTSLDTDHEHEHAEPPSDIESYDDAFASDDDRALDSAHLMSARPREEGETAPFAPTPEPRLESGDVSEVVNIDEHEHEDTVEDTKDVDASLSEDEHKSDTEESQQQQHPEDTSIELEVGPITTLNGNGSATPTASKHNGMSVPDTEFDNVLGMLQVKPPASLENIPDIDE